MCVCVRECVCVWVCVCVCIVPGKGLRSTYDGFLSFIIGIIPKPNSAREKPLVFWRNNLKTLYSLHFLKATCAQFYKFRRIFCRSIKSVELLAHSEGTHGKSLFLCWRNERRKVAQGLAEGLAEGWRKVFSRRNSMVFLMFYCFPYGNAVCSSQIN